MRDNRNLIGNEYGNLRVTGYDKEKSDEFYKKYHSTRRFWYCECYVCGHKTSTSTQELNKILKNDSIGCKECFYRRDLLGKTIGRLTVIKYIGSMGGKRKWLCRCECGNEIILNTGDLTRNKPILSCGCLKKEMLTDRNINTAKRGGDSINPEYKRLYGIWNGILTRCENKNHHSYEQYGNKNIKVCDEWHDWDIFKQWALDNGYSKELSIDRIDVKGNYEPSNCRWATAEEQANNTTRNINITINNKTQTLSQWCKEYQVDYDKARRAIVDLKKDPKKVLIQK